MTKLQRALYYEVQYRNAIVSDSIAFFDVNLSKDLVENDFFEKQTSAGMPMSCLEHVGLAAPCKFSEFNRLWYENQVPDEHKGAFPLKPDFNQTLINYFNEGKREYIVNYWTYNAAQELSYVNQKFLLTKNEDGDICALSVVKNITNSKLSEEEERRKELEKYAYVDPVTGGYNYNKFKEILNKSEKPGSIISIDIHSFKVLNSICGVVKGDEVLKTIWECIRSVVGSDEGSYFAHIHADHFAIFVPTDDEDYIISKIKNISLALSLISVELDVPQVLPYFGIARWHPEKKIELAYSEAVSAKHNSRDLQDCNYSFFDESATNRLVEEKKMEDSFERALENKEFVLWYQPKYNPITKKLVGAEALVRWQKSDGTIVPPGVFIPLFERNGMIRILDEYVFRAVCGQQKLWQRIGKEIVPVSINLSRASLYYKTIVNQYKLIAEDLGIDKNYIPLEITESAAVNSSELKDIADNFYNCGFRLHMDDFGSGYSSLASLNTMHFDTLKLDKSLIDFIGNFGGERLLEHTISLAKELGMHVTAEGVEKATQVVFLKHSGCDSIQGFFYSKPLPLEEFERRLPNREEVKKDEKVDYAADHIGDFRRSLLRQPIYSFIANITQNYFDEVSGSAEWHSETKFDKTSYTDCVEHLAKEYILDEYKEGYLNFMNRETLLKEFKGLEETKFYTYKRVMKGEISKMRLMVHTFKTEDNQDLMAFITVTVL